MRQVLKRRKSVIREENAYPLQQKIDETYTKMLECDRYPEMKRLLRNSLKHCAMP